MSNVSVFSAANLPSLTDMASALKSNHTPVASSLAYIKLHHIDAKWVFGSEEEEVEPDSLWAVNPYSLIRGYICWAPSKLKLGEIMAPAWEPLPEPGPLPVGADKNKGWELQTGFSLKCVSGKHRGTEALYLRTSFGSRKMYEKLVMDIVHQIDVDKTTPLPIVKLSYKSYESKHGNTIHNPVLEIVRWEAPGNLSVEEDIFEELEPVEIEATPANVRRRRPS